MELNLFMRELENALVQRGISSETAKKHVASFRRTFTSDDLSEIEAIQSGSEIEQLADSIAQVLKKNMKSERKAAPTSAAKPAAPRPRPQNAAVGQGTPAERSTAPSSQANPQVKTGASAARPKPTETAAPSSARPAGSVSHTASRPEPQTKAAPKQEPVVQRRRLDIPEEDDEDQYYTYAPGADVTTRGMILFWVGLFVTLPITLGLAAILFGAFAAVFVGLAVLIVGLIVGLIAIAACGAGISLVGIIFGITQLFTFVAAGIYEIGLGIMVAGGVLFVSVLLYNIAIRFLPWLIVLVGNLLGWVCGKLKNLFFVVRRECYKL